MANSATQTDILKQQQNEMPEVPLELNSCKTVSSEKSETCSSPNSATCPAASTSSTALEIIDPCCLWSCPIDSLNHESSTAQCAICLQTVPPTSLLPCSQCRQAGCINCHLKNLSFKKYDSRQGAFAQKASCFFCRSQYAMLQLQQLELIYKAHQQQLGFPLWTQPLVQSDINNLFPASFGGHHAGQPVLGAPMIECILMFMIGLTCLVPLSLVFLVSPIFRCILGVLVALIIAYIIVYDTVTLQTADQQTQTDDLGFDEAILDIITALSAAQQNH